MIPTIGIMIGAYIFTRMIKQAKSDSAIETAFAIVTMAIAVFGSISLLMK